MKKKRPTKENLSTPDHHHILDHPDAHNASRELTIRTYISMGYSRAEAENMVVDKR